MCSAPNQLDRLHTQKKHTEMQVSKHTPYGMFALQEVQEQNCFTLASDSQYRGIHSGIHDVTLVPAISKKTLKTLMKAWKCRRILTKEWVKKQRNLALWKAFWVVISHKCIHTSKIWLLPARRPPPPPPSLCELRELQHHLWFV